MDQGKGILYLLQFLYLLSLPLIISTTKISNRIACYQGKNDLSKQNYCHDYLCYTLIHYTNHGVKIRRGCVRNNEKIHQNNNDSSFSITFCNTTSFCNNDTGNPILEFEHKNGSSKIYNPILRWGLNIYGKIHGWLKERFF